MQNSQTQTKKTEQELIAEAKSGDEQAFELLAQSYKRVLEYHIKRIDANPSNYDDLFQEGLIGLLKAVRSYDGTSSAFATYASLCVRNSIISGVRKYANQTTHTVPISEPCLEEETTPSAEEVLLDRVRVGQLYDKVYEALSPYEKIVFDMYLSDIPYESMAFVIGKNVKSISNAVFRIRNKLRQIVGNAHDFAHQTEITRKGL